MSGRQERARSDIVTSRDYNKHSLGIFDGRRRAETMERAPDNLIIAKRLRWVTSDWRRTPAGHDDDRPGTGCLRPRRDRDGPGQRGRLRHALRDPQEGAGHPDAVVREEGRVTDQQIERLAVLEAACAALIKAPIFVVPDSDDVHEDDANAAWNAFVDAVNGTGVKS